MHSIPAKRKAIKDFFDSHAKIEGDSIYAISDSGLYYFETEKYVQNDPERNWIITKIMIFDTEKACCIFEYFTDHDAETFAWISINTTDYLLFPEFLGGYSIFNTASLELHSYYCEDDPFIWQEITFSPQQMQLVVTGNYWACPSEIISYSCAACTALPYPILQRTYTA